VLPIARVFGLSIQAPLLAVLIGFGLAVELARRLATRYNLDANTLTNVLTNAIFAFILGARLGYVIVNAPSYLKDPLGALALNTTAMLPWAGWVAALIFTVLSLHRKRVLTIDLARAILPAACVLGMGLAVSDLLSGANFGIPAALPWSIDLWGARRHPVQVYEFLVWGVILIALLWANWRKIPAGALVWLAIALAAVGRVWVDGYRAEVPLLLGVRVTQLAGVLVALVALWLLEEAMKPAPTPVLNQPEVSE